MTYSNRFRPFLLILILSWLFLGGSAKAAEYEPLTHIRDAALAHAQTITPAGAKLTPSRFDERLRLVACPEPLATRTASDSGSALNVEVRCDAIGWKLFVPVSVSIKVPVLVVKRSMVRGDILSAADVDVQLRERGSLGPAWLESPDQLLGRVLTRPVASGTILSPTVLVAANVIKRGQSVMLVGQSGSFQVRAEGKALSDAAPGEQIRVQNLSSRRIVEGQVRDDGTVLVSL